MKSLFKTEDGKRKILSLYNQKLKKINIDHEFKPQNQLWPNQYNYLGKSIKPTTCDTAWLERMCSYRT